MVKKHKKSDLLKDKILDVSGRYFKEYGYDKTTFQMIADELSISKPSISYHFKSKAWLVFSLFSKGMESIYKFVTENADESFNKFKLHCIMHIYFYRKIMGRECNWNLYYSEDHRQLWMSEQLYIVEDYLKEIMDDFKKEFNGEDLHTTAVMCLGAKLSMFKDFTQNSGRISIDGFCYHTAFLVGLLSKLDEATVTKNVQCAFEFADSHPLPPTYFLD